MITMKRWIEVERLRLPYGIWTCVDSREVLFNRKYQPIWQRMPGQPATAGDPEERVPFAEQKWFYRDGDSPRVDKQALARCEAILVEWGVA